MAKKQQHNKIFGTKMELTEVRTFATKQEAYRDAQAWVRSQRGQGRTVVGNFELGYDARDHKGCRRESLGTETCCGGCCAVCAEAANLPTADKIIPGVPKGTPFSPEAARRAPGSGRPDLAELVAEAEAEAEAEGGPVFDEEAEVVPRRLLLETPKAGDCSSACQEKNVWLMLDLVLPRVRRALMYGPPSTGKTFAACRSAETLGDELFVITMTDQTPMAELRGHFVPKGGNFEFMYGNALRPFKYGGLLVINEIDEAGADALAFLVALLDDPAVAKITLPTGETVKAHPNFRVIASMNGHYTELHERLQSRFPEKVYVDAPHPDALASLPEDLRAVAAKLSIEADENLRVDIRSWKEFAELRTTLSHERLAARAVFGPRATDVLAAIKATNDPTTETS